MLARSSCTASLGAGQPLCAGPAGPQGFTDGALPGGVAHGESRPPLAAVAAFESAAALRGSLVHGARLRVMFARGKGFAAWRMNFTACGNAAVPQRFDIKKTAMAGMLRVTEYIFFSRPDL